MTTVEAELGARKRHEFRTFQLGERGGTIAECWCGATTAECLLPTLAETQKAARNAHGRHQEKETHAKT